MEAESEAGGLPSRGEGHTWGEGGGRWRQDLSAAGCFPGSPGRWTRGGALTLGHLPTPSALSPSTPGSALKWPRPSSSAAYPRQRSGRGDRCAPDPATGRDTPHRTRAAGTAIGRTEKPGTAVTQTAAPPCPPEAGAPVGEMMAPPMSMTSAEQWGWKGREGGLGPG